MDRNFRRLQAALLASGLAAVAAVHGCNNEETGGALCEPGANIFCRCPGGAPGTKACNEAGDAFGACEPCEQRPSTGPAQQASSSSGFGGDGGSGAAGGGGAGPVGENPLLAFCITDGDCQSGRCHDSFCTKQCQLVSDCPYPASECIPMQGGAICMPSCSSAVDCSAYQAPPSLCGYTQAIDLWGVTVCANWDAAHQLIPIGTDCLPFDHEACNLGYSGRERVCTEQGVCAEGCYLNSDCPTGQTCSSQGSLGTCQ